jgi:hypothetical protein
VHLLTAALLGCYGPVTGDFEVWGCAGGEVGQFTAAGFGGVPGGRTTHQFWAAGLLQAEASRALTRGLSLALGAQGAFAPERIRVVRTDPNGGPPTPDYTTKIADIRPWLGVEGRF